MKKVLLIFTVLLSAVFVSCSSNSKSITPTSTEFTSGELAKYVEIVDQPSELTFAEKDDVIETQYIRLKVTLKMVKDGFKDVDARDIDFTGLLSVAVINLVDENGTEVQDLSVKSEDLLKLKKLLTGNEGDTEEIIFEGEFHNRDDAPNWFKEASQFTPYLSGDISVENSSVPYDDMCSSNSKSITPTSTEFTSGELAKYVEIVDQPSELTFAEKDDVIETQYIRLKVTLKMVKDGFKDVDARDIDFTGLLSVAVINLVDENGTEVQDLSVKSEDLLKLKKLLTGNEGDTEEIIFEGEFHNRDDAPNWFKEASQFTPYLSGDISL